MFLTGTEPRQKHSSTNSITTSCLTLMSLDLTPQSKRSPSLLRSSKGPTSRDRQGCWENYSVPWTLYTTTCPPFGSTSNESSKRNFSTHQSTRDQGPPSPTIA